MRILYLQAVDGPVAVSSKLDTQDPAGCLTLQLPEDRAVWHNITLADGAGRLVVIGLVTIVIAAGPGG